MMQNPESYAAVDRYPLTTTPNTPVEEAIALMSQQGTSCILVQARPERPSPLVGLFTERDVVRLTASGADLSNLLIGAVMTTHLTTIAQTEAQDVFAVANMFRQHQIRHLPVVDEEGNLVGLVTPTSMLEAINPIEIYQSAETLQHLVDEQTCKLRQLNQQLQQESGDRQLLEEKIHTSEVKMRAVFAAMTDLVFVIELRGSQLGDIEVLPTNPNLLYEIGTDLNGQTVEAFFQEPTAQAWLVKIRQALETQQTLNFDYSLFVDRKLVWFSARISPISERSVIWVARDISDRKQAEAETLHSKNLLEAIFNESADAIGSCGIMG